MEDNTKEPAARKRNTGAQASKAAKSTKTAAKAKTPQKGKQTPRKRSKTKPAPKRDRTGVGGRKKLWTELHMPDKLDAVKGWAMQGATDVELSEMLGIGTSTFYEWKKAYPEFSEALRKGREISNGELIASAFRQSIGYTVKDRKPIKVKRWEWAYHPITKQPIELVCNEYVEVVEVDVAIAANANITQFMLMNRLRGDYQKREHVEVTPGAGGGFGYLSDADLEMELAKMRGEAEEDE